MAKEEDHWVLSNFPGIQSKDSPWFSVWAPALCLEFNPLIMNNSLLSWRWSRAWKSQNWIPSLLLFQVDFSSTISFPLLFHLSSACSSPLKASSKAQILGHKHLDRSTFSYKCHTEKEGEWGTQFLGLLPETTSLFLCCSAAKFRSTFFQPCSSLRIPTFQPCCIFSMFHQNPRHLKQLVYTELVLREFNSMAVSPLTTPFSWQ